MVKIGLYVETEDARVSIEPKDTITTVEDSGDGKQTVAGPGLLQLANIAACVITCLAASQRTAANMAAMEKGGAHQSPPAESNTTPKARPPR